MKPIPGVYGYYADEHGCIWSDKRGTLTRRSATKKGGTYLGVSLSSSGVVTTHYVHELVALAFHGERPAGWQVMHLDDDPLNNRADNLRYGTPQENYAQIWTTGRGRRGERQPMSKLTAEIVVEIRLAAATGESHGAIAARVGCSSVNVWKIVHRKKWAHVP